LHSDYKNVLLLQSNEHGSLLMKLCKLVLALSLSACGGGGGSEGNNVTVNTDSTNPTLPTNAIILAISTKPDEISIAWIPATDDVSTAEEIAYEIHAGDTTGFTISTTSLVATYSGIYLADVGGFQGNTTYYLKAVAVDKAGNKSNASNAISAVTASSEATIDTTIFNNTEAIGDTAPTVIDTQYTYAKTSSSAAPTVGQVIVGENADGSYYLRTVESVTENNTEIIVETSDGSLDEIIDDGIISSNIVLSEPVATGNKGVAYRSGNQGGYPVTENTWQNNSFSITQTDYATVLSQAQKYQNNDGSLRHRTSNKTTYQTQTSGEELTFTASIEFEPSIATYAKFSVLSGLESADVYAEGKFDLNATLAYNFSGSSSLSQSKQLFKRSYRSLYTLGPVPVEQVITLTIDAEFSANAQTQITAEAVSELLADVKFGVRYLNGQWSLIDEKNVTKSMTITATVEGVVTAEVRLVPNIEVKFYKVASAGLSVEPYLTGTAAAEIVSNTDLLNQAGFNSYRFTRLDAALGLDANVYAHLKILSKTLARYPSLDPNEKKTIFSLNYPLFSLPEISLAGNGVPQLSNSSFILTATTVDGVDNAFDDASIEWLAFPSGSVSINPNDPQSATFTPNAEDIDYTIYFIGNGSSIGSIGRQFESFSVSYQDTDNDGMPNAWELAYGLDSNNSSDGLSNPDGDGFTNLEEYNNGTNPSAFDSGGLSIPQSPVNIEIVSSESQITLSWDSVNDATEYSVYIAEQTEVTAANYSTYTGGAVYQNATSPYIINSLTNGTTYYVVVTAVNAIGESLESTEGSATPQGGAISPRPPNDTGLTWGGNYEDGNNGSCIGETIGQQDCKHGRDFTHNDDSDGHAGFSFTKLGATGDPLAASASTWSCVKDNVTGLIWEVKTDDGGIHDKDNTYRWGGKTALLTSSFGTVYDDWDTLVDGSNTANLCGFSDWRVPSRIALASIVNFNRVNPWIDTGYFLNTPSSGFWSASASAAYSAAAWNVHFGYGMFTAGGRNFSYQVRLVRGGQ
jgi:hypothetical protein